MLNYKDCKELKDAGLPQNVECPHHAAERCSCYKKYEPTLEELIEACGDEFGSLQFCKGNEFNKMSDHYIAYPTPERLKKIIAETQCKLRITGNSPIQAVKGLYLALNKK